MVGRFTSPKGNVMPFLALPFPDIDPVLVQLGPFAIRWYALAYIGGILLGWLYARALIRAEQLWGGPPPIDARRLRRLHRVGDARHHPRRPARLRAVLQPGAISPRTRSRALQLWNGGMSFHGGFVGCVARGRAVREKRNIPVLSLGDLTCAVGADRAVPRAAGELHQWRIVGTASRRALGDGVSRRRPAAAPSEPALRGDARRARAVRRALPADARRRAASGPG